jgi:hypothetical protein
VSLDTTRAAGGSIKEASGAGVTVRRLGSRAAPPRRYELRLRAATADGRRDAVAVPLIVHPSH